MPDSKLSDLTADTAPTGDDLIYTVNDPAGTPADRKVTITSLAASAPFTGAFQPIDADLTDIAGIADAQGDIIVRGAAGWERLAKSATSTHVLTAGASQPGWAAPSGGGSSDASALGMIDFTNATYGGVCDGRTVADGVATAASTTLTSATAAFVSGDVGKVINVSVADRIVTDAAITSAATALTSATAAFTTADVGKTVHIDGAGAAGVALVTTIASFTSSTEVQTTATAGTTVTGKNLFIRTAPHQTTIASINSGTSVVLTAAPTFTYASASLCIGTENRVAFAAAVAAAVSAQKALWIPPGTGFAMISLSAANPNAAATFNNDLRLVGSGQGQSRIVVVAENLLTSAARHLLLPGSNSAAPVLLDVEDITVDYVGPPPNNNQYGPWIIKGTPTLQGEKIRLHRVTSTGFPMGIIVQGSTGANSRLIELNHTTLACGYQAIQLYTDNSGTDPYDAVLRVRNSRFEQTFRAITQTDDSGYNSHIIYIHPSVSVDIEGMVTKAVTTAIGQYHIHINGSPTQPIKFFTISNWRTDQDSTTPGFGIALLHARNALSTYGVATLESCNFEYMRGAIAMGSKSLSVSNSQFRCRGAVITGSGSATSLHRFSGCHFNNEVTTANDNMIVVAGVGATWEFLDSTFLLVTGSGDAITTGTESTNVLVRGCAVHSVSGATGAFTESARHNMTIDSCVFSGVWGDTILAANFGGDDQGALVLSNNIFRQTSGAVTRNNRAFNVGNVRGWDNIVPSNTLGFLAASGSGALVPPRRKSATAVASAAQLDLTWNHDSFDISGTTTINNIYVGGAATSNRLRGGDLFLIATGAWTLAHNVSGTGNIRMVSGANLVMAVGQTIHLRADERNNLWYEVGHAGARTTFTQTYATADATHAARLATAVATTGASQSTPFGYTTAAQADDIITQLNNLRTDQLDTAQVVNSVIDALQALGISL